MKKAIVLGLGAALLLCGACASPGGGSGYQEVVDTQKMDLVDRWARQNNVTVIWVNRPTRSVPVPAGS